MDKIVTSVNNLIETANNFSYFVFLSTFVIFLDSVLIHSSGISIYELKWNYIESKFSIGSILVFLSMFSLFMAVIVSTCQIILFQFVLSLPRWLRVHHTFQEKNDPDYLSLERLRIYAIKNDNSIANSIMKEKKAEIRARFDLEKQCFGFMLASLLSYIVGFYEHNSIVFQLFMFSGDGDLFSFSTLKSILVGLVYIIMFYLGIVRGCGFETFDFGFDKVYFPQSNKETTNS